LLGKSVRCPSCRSVIVARAKSDLAAGIQASRSRPANTPGEARDRRQRPQ
jgi:hypothetical protein